MDFCDVDFLKFLKYCLIRWLSFEKCVKRLLYYWFVLISYFNLYNDVEKFGRVKRVVEFFRSYEMRMIFYFLGYVLELLNEFNIIF